MPGYLWTGQKFCYDINGTIVPCMETGQDGDFKTGIPWPRERFTAAGGLVFDHLTGLQWLKNANPAEFPITWQEALDYISGMNREKREGCSDWRLPNRRELRSLMAFETRKPALPLGHPFENVFLGWYWTSTTSAVHSGYAWYIHMEGARLYIRRVATRVADDPVLSEYGVTVSMGLSQFDRTSMKDPEDMVQAADADMYHAKNARQKEKRAASR